MEIFIIILLCVLSAGFAASPFIADREEWVSSSVDKRLDKMQTQKEIYYQAIKDVDFEHAEGKLTEKDYHELRDYYKEKAIQTVREIETLEEGEAESKEEDQ